MMVMVMIQIFSGPNNIIFLAKIVMVNMFLIGIGFFMMIVTVAVIVHTQAYGNRPAFFFRERPKSSLFPSLLMMMRPREKVNCEKKIRACNNVIDNLFLINDFLLTDKHTYTCIEKNKSPNKYYFSLVYEILFHENIIISI